jgi:endoglucanase Acf2
MPKKGKILHGWSDICPTCHRVIKDSRLIEKRVDKLNIALDAVSDLI